MTMAEIITRRHPIRGALYGLILGLAIWYFLQIYPGVFGWDSLNGLAIRLGIVVGAGITVGILWAYVAPPRKPKGAAPAPAASAPPSAAAPPEDGAPALPDAEE
jgi:hypothetical protein